MRFALTSFIFALFLFGCSDTPEPKPEAKESAPSADSSLSKGAALVLTLKGKVSVVSPSDVNGTAATENQFLSPGNSLVTDEDSEALLLLTNGTTLSVGANTTFELKAFYQDGFDAGKDKVGSLKEEASPSTVLIDLKVGDLVVDVKKLRKKSNFDISTPLGVAGIRGTSFKLIALAEATTLSVLTGRVDFVSPAKESFQVEASQVILAPKGEDPKVSPLTDAEKQAIQEAVDKAREKAEEVDLDTLKDGLRIAGRNKRTLPLGWTTKRGWRLDASNVLEMQQRLEDDSQVLDSFLWSEQAQNDFTLSFEYKYKSGYEGGVLLFASNKTNLEGSWIFKIGDRANEGGFSGPGKFIEGKWKLDRNRWGVGSSRKDASKGVDEWNLLKIIVDRPKIKINLNGFDIIDLPDSWSSTSRGKRAITHLKAHLLKDRWIAIMDNGYPVSFRNLSIRRLSKGPLGGMHTVPSAANLEMIWVEPGTFMMGSPPTEEGRADDETQQEVTLTKGFYLGEYEVTQAQYEAITGINPSQFKTPDRPVENINWHEAQSYCEKISQLEKNAGRLPSGWSFSLPTEAQWEYACRAGTTTAYWWGDEVNTSLVNYKESGFGKPVKVGQYPPNPWGFHDMHGNVWEWCTDWMGPYKQEKMVDPTGPTKGKNRAIRGASWINEGVNIRSGQRCDGVRPTVKNERLGFRLALRKTN